MKTSHSDAAAAAAKLCVAEGCSVILSCHPRYFQQKGLCPEHIKADAIRTKDQQDGDEWCRFCQQCGKLEPVELFDGYKRSCRAQLARRRAVSFRVPSTSRSSSATSETAATSSVLRPVRGRVKKAVSHGSMEAMVQRAKRQQQEQQQQQQASLLQQQQQQRQQNHADIGSRLLSIQQQLNQLEWHAEHAIEQAQLASQLQQLQQSYQQLLLSSAQLQDWQAVAQHNVAPSTGVLDGHNWPAAGLALGLAPSALPVMLAPATPALAAMPVMLPAARAASAIVGRIGVMGLHDSHRAVALAGSMVPAMMSAAHAAQAMPELCPSMLQHGSSSSSLSVEVDGGQQDDMALRQHLNSLTCSGASAGVSPAFSFTDGASGAACAATAPPDAGIATVRPPAAPLQPLQQQQQLHARLPSFEDLKAAMGDGHTDLRQLLAQWEQECDLQMENMATDGGHGRVPSMQVAPLAAGDVWASQCRAPAEVLMQGGTGAATQQTAGAGDGRPASIGSMAVCDFAGLLDELLLEADA